MAAARVAAGQRAARADCRSSGCHRKRHPSELEKIVKKTSVPFAVMIWRQIRVKFACRTRCRTLAAAGPILVGPDLVLTNHHVIMTIAGQTGAHTAAGVTADPKIIVRFDYKELDDKSPVNPGVEVTLAGVAREQSAERGRHAAGAEEGHADDRRAGSRLIGWEPSATGPFHSAPARTGLEERWIELPAANGRSGISRPVHHATPEGEPMKLALDLEAKMTVNANHARYYQTGTGPARRDRRVSISSGRSSRCIRGRSAVSRPRRYNEGIDQPHRRAAESEESHRWSDPGLTGCRATSSWEREVGSIP
jgi:hypothetical protein